MEIIFDEVSYNYPSLLPAASPALKRVSLSIPSGQYVTLMGPNGGGKSTAAQMINALVLPDSGEVRVGEFRIHHKSKRHLPLRQQVGFLFQNPKYQLFGDTVFHDICFGLRLMGISEEMMRAKAMRAMERVGLSYEEFADVSPHRLSGGLMRRAALAGILAVDPEILVLDEPTSGLDPQSRQEILALVKHLNREHGKTIVHITHRIEEAVESDRILVLQGGEVRADVLTSSDDLWSQLSSLGFMMPPYRQLMQRLERLLHEPFSEPINSEQQLIDFLKMKIREAHKEARR